MSRATCDLYICLSMKNNMTQRRRPWSRKHCLRSANITPLGRSSWTFKRTNWNWVPSKPSVTTPRPVALPPYRYRRTPPQCQLQRRHQHLSRARCGQRNPDQECRRGHVLRQSEWTQRLSVLHRRHERSGCGAIDLGEQPATGTRQERTLSDVPTADEYCLRKDHRTGSTAALATPETGSCATR